MTDKKTLVIGASTNPSRYSYLAVRKLVAHNHTVVALGRKPGKVGPIDILTDIKKVDQVDTVTLYLNPQNQKPYYEQILSLKPKRIIFNPGTENEEFEALAEQQGIEVMEGCTLVMLSTGQY
jgi:predicted CoA-binding protein